MFPLQIRIDQTRRFTSCVKCPVPHENEDQHGYRGPDLPSGNDFRLHHLSWTKITRRSHGIRLPNQNASFKYPFWRPFASVSLIKCLPNVGIGPKS